MRQKLKYAVILTIVMAALVSVLNASGAFVGLDNKFVELRQLAAPKIASGKIVLVAIDKHSLDEVGVWPWPRSIYGSLIDRLTEYGAQDIFIDIDFSNRSIDANDRLLASALEKAGGGVILPTFRQQQKAGSKQVVFTQPIEMIAAQSWLGLANVASDPDGYVRRIPGGEPKLDLEPAPWLLAGATSAGKELLIDFSIQPGSVDTMSLIDVLNGTIDKQRLDGKSVVIGATAAELKDAFIVPVYGLLSGPMIHVLATETIIQGRIFSLIDFWPLGAAVFCLVLLLMYFCGTARLLPRIAPLLAISVALEIAGFCLQSYWAILIPTGALQAFLACCVLASVIREIDIKETLLSLARIDRNNTRIIFERVIADSADALVILRPDLTIVESSRNAGSILHSGKSLAVGDNIVGNLPQPLEIAILRDVATLEAGGAGVDLDVVEFEISGMPCVVEYSVTASTLEDGRRKRPSEPTSVVYCVAARDITKLRAQQLRIEYLSRYDPLTDAALRTTLLDEITARIGQPFAVYVVNLKRFRNVNAALGRRIGDALLKEVAARLGKASHHGKAVGRLGGDTFVSIVDLRDQTQSANHIAEALIDILETPYQIEGKSVQVGARVGFSAYGADYDGSAVEALERAELALDEGGVDSATAVFRYTPAIAAARYRREVLEHALGRALEFKQIEVFYQPQVNLGNGDLIGAEALVRWRHPELGMISPVEFIPIAEANGMINQIGLFALKTACHEAKQWAPHIGISVNLSPLQLLKDDLFDQITTNLDESGLAPNRLTLEVTESAFQGGMEKHFSMLARFRELGIEIGLDDFGTGYSSLSQLTRFPLDEIKIDKSFVDSLMSSATSRAVIQSIQTLARTIGAYIVCEGIENIEQQDFLRAIGCSVGQGYLYGKPMAQADFRKFMARQPEERQLNCA